jgi:hypothetical protein
VGVTFTENDMDKLIPDHETTRYEFYAYPDMFRTTCMKESVGATVKALGPEVFYLAVLSLH